MTARNVVRTLARRSTAVIAIGSAALLSGCIHVSQRVLDNGRAMQSSWQYREVLRGNANPSVLRGMYYNSNVRSLGYSSTRYVPFGNW